LPLDHQMFCKQRVCLGEHELDRLCTLNPHFMIMIMIMGLNVISCLDIEL
jgi:hypothetical protein